MVPKPLVVTVWLGDWKFTLLHAFMKSARKRSFIRSPRRLKKRVSEML
jgi:hypothetical protein